MMPVRGCSDVAAAIALVLLGLFSLPQPTASWSLQDPPDWAAGFELSGVNTSRNITDTCKKLAYEARELCSEYTLMGLTGEECDPWGQTAEFWCLNSGANCSTVGYELRELCRFQLQWVVSNPTYRNEYCNESETQFVLYRCPPTAYAPLNDTLCHVTDTYDDRIRFYSDEAYSCMQSCGTYQTCYCREQKGSFMPDYCHGDVVVNEPLPGTWDPFANAFVSAGNYSCDTLGQPPDACRHHIAEGTTCSKYKHCSPDHCIIRNISCPNRTQCEAEGTCDPADGWCHYSNKPDGYTCNDGLFYTLGDQCIGGICVGVVDYCLKYNTTCIPESVCLTTGTCNPITGRCVYEKVDDGTVCDDERDYTVEDRCDSGLCLGKVVNLCVERGVICDVPNSCYDPGVCDPLTGMCSDAVIASDGRYCDDQNPDTVNETCVDGICLGFPTGMRYEFQTLTGFGECSDRDYRRMGRYSGDVLEGEDGCVKACLDDVQCVAYGYAYPLCSIYGTVRIRAPPGADRPWAFELGTDPPAVAIEMTKPPVVGQRATVCRKKGILPDVLEPDAQHDVNREDWFNFLTIFYMSLGMAFFFLFWPISLAAGAFFCPKRFAEQETWVEVIETAPTRPKENRKDRRRRRKRGRRGLDDEDEESDDLRAIAAAAPNQAALQPPEPPQAALEADGEPRPPSGEHPHPLDGDEALANAAYDYQNVPQTPSGMGASPTADEAWGNSPQTPVGMGASPTADEAFPAESQPQPGQGPSPTA
mmetsp:Transcript_97642/g.244696  ORF Transcript_97642/g.244696 Transcript_97642/m.244696 type:complete len:757 (+) Transcript_97642:120-2390(+)